ncbi:MAG: hypothetical protein AB7S36_21195 [Planctomycetota bacterium]
MREPADTQDQRIDDAVERRLIVDARFDRPSHADKHDGQLGARADASERLLADAAADREPEAEAEHLDAGARCDARVENRIDAFALQVTHGIERQRDRQVQATRAVLRDRVVAEAELESEQRRQRTERVGRRGGGEREADATHEAETRTVERAPIPVGHDVVVIQERVGRHHHVAAVAAARDLPEERQLEATDELPLRALGSVGRLLAHGNLRTNVDRGQHAEAFMIKARRESLEHRVHEHTPGDAENLLLRVANSRDDDIATDHHVDVEFGIAVGGDAHRCHFRSDHDVLIPPAAIRAIVPVRVHVAVGIGDVVVVESSVGPRRAVRLVHMPV